MTRDTSKRVSDTLKSINNRGYDPYNKADCLGWMYDLKWRDDCRRSEFQANAKLNENASRSR
jgi:hypothetical protein